MEDVSTPSRSFYARHEFLIRRLHSLSGLIPVGVFLLMHLSLNFTPFLDPALFQQGVDQIHMLGAALWIVEWLGIFLPILFHGIVGLWIVYEGQSNSSQYPYRANYRYTLQRITGVLAFVFIIYHVAHMHHYGAYLDPILGEGVGGQFDPHAPHAAPSAAAALAPWWVKALYVVGLSATVFHLANGVWTFGITWGLWITPQAQRRADGIAIGVGVLLMALGLGSLVGLSKPELVEEGQAWAEQRRKQDIEPRDPERDADPAGPSLDDAAEANSADEADQAGGG